VIGFIHSRFCRTVSRALVTALAWNFLILALPAPKAEAQFAGAAPQWAVLDFVNKSNIGGNELGSLASDALTTDLLGTNRFNILPRETVDRAMRDLGLQAPLSRELDVLRVAQALGVETIIVGEVSAIRINKGQGGKSADVALIVRGLDVASGLPVLGAAVAGQSAERPGDVSDDVVIDEAIRYASQEATRSLLEVPVDIATVLTTPTPQFVTLNKGTRQGVKVGQEMVVLRGREQVAIIRISEVTTDASTGRLVSSQKGVAPGDKARLIFRDLPKIELTSRGPKTRTTKRNDATGVLLALAVIGLLALALQKGGGGNAPGEFIVEAGVAEDGVSPVIHASWKPNIFVLGNSSRVEWQVWRTDYNPTPVEVVNGQATFVLDRTAPRIRLWRDFGTNVGGTACEEDPGQEEFDVAAPGIVPGVSYRYQLSLIYKMSSLDVPGADQQDVTDCYFQSSRLFSKGQATAMSPAILTTPTNGATDVQSVTQFSWSSVAGADEYIVQISTTPTFARNTVRDVANVTTLLQGGVSTDPVNISNVFPGVQRLYWRVGARNSADFPGPKADPATGQRYVFSRPFQFDRVVLPPPPPIQ
jgi:hypothetical protein